MADPPLLICDLDGTLIDGNSFRLLLREATRPSGMRMLGLQATLDLHRVLARRALRRIDRLGMKRLIHARLASVPAEGRRLLADRVCLAMHKRVRPEVAAAVALARGWGFTTVLATAGLEEHANLLADALGFDHCLATAEPKAGQPWVELSGEAKQGAVSALAEAIGAGRPWVLLSDHPDDEPLADRCDRAFWVCRRTPLRAPGSEQSFTPASFERWGSALPRR